MITVKKENTQKDRSKGKWKNLEKSIKSFYKFYLLQVPEAQILTYNRNITDRQFYVGDKEFEKVYIQK